MLSAGNYDEYFGMSTDVEAVVYLMLMNTMIHDYFPTSITIGEDVSGMPTFCRSACLPSCTNILYHLVHTPDAPANLARAQRCRLIFVLHALNAWTSFCEDP